MAVAVGSEAVHISAQRFADLIEKLRRVSLVLSGVEETLRRGDFEGVWKLLRSTVDSAPDHALAHYGLAIILERSGDLVGAISHAERVAQLMPSDIEAWRLFAKLTQDQARQHEQSLVRARASVGQLRTQLSHGERTWRSVEGERNSLQRVRDALDRFVAYSQTVPITIIDAGDGSKITQVERDNFVEVASRLEERGRSDAGNFLRGISEALKLDPYEGSRRFYDWLTASPSTARLTVVVPPPDFLNSLGGRAINHGITIHLGGPEAGSVDDRCDRLLEFVELNRRVSVLFAHGSANRALAVAEALMMAVARHYGTAGQPEKALGKITEMLDGELGWQAVARTVHLKAVKHCLELIQRGEPVPPHLRKFVSDDDEYLKARICSHPFTRLDLVHGDVAGRDAVPVARVCCTHWLPTIIGTLEDRADDILNSPMAQEIRKSMLDGTFKYCDHLNCQSLVNDALPLKSEVTDPDLRRAIDTGDLTVERARIVLLAIDDTCNLSCPSCRVEVRSVTRAQKETLLKLVEKTVLPMLSKASEISIDPAGEVMVSEPSLAVLRYINDETCPNLKVRIITNGTRLSEEEWAKFPGIHNKMQRIRVSLDAARKETFEKLRRGASYDEVWRNLLFLSRLRKSGKIPRLQYSFTYQLDNFREMPEFVRIGLDHGVDALLFERLMNMGAFTSEEYRERAVHMLDHPLYPEFQKVLQHPLMKERIVAGDLAHLRDTSSSVVAGVGATTPDSLAWHAPPLGAVGG